MSGMLCCIKRGEMHLLYYKKFYRCWQAESKLNLILKIPHTFLLLANLVCAAYIIRVLYSKLETKISREKVMKYR
jgi:hypothetical protein